MLIWSGLGDNKNGSDKRTLDHEGKKTIKLNTFHRHTVHIIINSKIMYTYLSESLHIYHTKALSKIQLGIYWNE